MEDIINRISKLQIPVGFAGLSEWESPSNIALVKYWGKKDFQIPSNPSLSFTLKNSVTSTRLGYIRRAEQKGLRLDFKFEGKENPNFKSRINKYLQMLAGLFPFMNKLHFTVESRNTFPHSAGIASSASSLSSLALCLSTMIKNIDSELLPEKDFYRFASYIARLGSGSASRSVYGGFVTWGVIDGIQNSSDDFASPAAARISTELTNIHDAVLIVDSREKIVSSSAGHQLMEIHPFASARFSQARSNIRTLIKALESGDFKTFIDITETEAMTLHSLMMSSSPGFLLIKSGTLHIIQKIKKARIEKGLDICYTLDAGPNVHLIYKSKDRDRVMEFLVQDLLDHCENGRWIDDRIGEGPKFISNE